MNNENRTIGIQLPKFLIDSIKFIVDQQGYLSRTDYIRSAIRKKVEEDLGGHDIDLLEKQQWYENEMDYKKVDIENIEQWLRDNTTRIIKFKVMIDYRQSNLDEIKRLLDNGISKNKVTALYGHSQKNFIYNYVGVDGRR